MTSKVPSVPNLVRPVRAYFGGLREPSPKVDLESQLPEPKVQKYYESDIPGGWKLLHKSIPLWLPKEKRDELKKEKRERWEVLIVGVILVAVLIFLCVGLAIVVHQEPQPRPDAIECKAVETQEHHSIEDFLVRVPEELEAQIKAWGYVPVKAEVAEDTQYV